MKSPRDPLVAGIVLILVGLGLFLLQNTDLDEAVLFLGIGGAFLAAHFYGDNYGLLVPGGILLGLGVGQILSIVPSGVADPRLLGLGLGFLIIYVVDRLHARTGGWWPLVPGGILLFLGLAEDSRFLQWFLGRGWPLLIALVGVILLLRGILGRERSAPGQES